MKKKACKRMDSTNINNFNGNRINETTHLRMICRRHSIGFQINNSNILYASFPSDKISRKDISIRNSFKTLSKCETIDLSELVQKSKNILNSDNNNMHNNASVKKYYNIYSNESTGVAEFKKLIENAISRNINEKVIKKGEKSCHVYRVRLNDTIPELVDYMKQLKLYSLPDDKIGNPFDKINYKKNINYSKSPTKNSCRDCNNHSIRLSSNINNINLNKSFKLEKENNKNNEVNDVIETRFDNLEKMKHKINESINKNKENNFELKQEVKKTSTYLKYPCWKKIYSVDKKEKLKSTRLQLSEEIIEYAEYTEKLVKEMKKKIETTIDNVRNCVKKLWKQATVDTFGSYATGLWLPSSDIDLVVLGVTKDQPSNAAIPYLKRLSKALENETWVKTILFVETAKVPIIKLVSSDSSVPIDITFESKTTHSGLLARDLIISFLKDIPELYRLAIVMKQLLREHGMNDAYTGGLSSYSTVLMIVHFLQLWKAGRKAYEDASIYASGSIPFHMDTSKPRSNRSDKYTKRNKNKLISPRLTSTTDKKRNIKLNKEYNYTERFHIENNNIKVTNESYDKVKNKINDTTITKTYASVAQSDKILNNINDPTQYKINKSVQPGLSYAAVATVGTNKNELNNNNTNNINDKEEINKNISKSYATIAANLVTPSKNFDKDTKTNLSILTKSNLPGKNDNYLNKLYDKRKDKRKVGSHFIDAEEHSSSCSTISMDSIDDTNNNNNIVNTISNLSNLSIENGSCEEIYEKIELGDHLINFLEFYGMIFNYRTSGISVRNGGFIYRLANPNPNLNLDPNPTSTNLSSLHKINSNNNVLLIGKLVLVIEDPIHPSHNVGACSFALQKIVHLFEDSYYSLKHFRPSKFHQTPLSSLLNSGGHESFITSQKISN